MEIVRSLTRQETYCIVVLLQESLSPITSLLIIILGVILDNSSQGFRPSVDDSAVVIAGVVGVVLAQVGDDVPVGGRLVVKEGGVVALRPERKRVSDDDDDDESSMHTL